MTIILNADARYAPGRVDCTAILALRVVADEHGAWWVPLSIVRRIAKPGVEEETIDPERQKTRALIDLASPESYVTAEAVEQLGLIAGATAQRRGDSISPLYPCLVDFLNSESERVFGFMKDFALGPSGGPLCMLGRDFAQKVGSLMVTKNKLWIHTEKMWWPSGRFVNPDDNELEFSGSVPG